MPYVALRGQIRAIVKAYGEDFDWSRLVVDVATSVVFDDRGRKVLRVGDGIPARGLLPCNYLIERISQPFTDDQGRKMIQLSLHEEPRAKREGAR